MKVIYNNLIPFRGFIAINLFGLVFVRNEYKGKIEMYDTLNHEAIHTAQMREMLYVGFYVWYFIEWIIKLFKYGKNAYWYLLHEQEAFHYERYNGYLKDRKPYAWLRMKKRKV